MTRFINTTPIIWNGNHSPSFRRGLYILANRWSLEPSELYKQIREAYMNYLAVWDDEVRPNLFSLRGMALDNRVDYYLALRERDYDIRACKRLATDGFVNACRVLMNEWTWHRFLSARHPSFARRDWHAEQALILNAEIIAIEAKAIAHNQRVLARRSAAALICPPTQPSADDLTSLNPDGDL
jgi:hypothetical protein